MQADLEQQLCEKVTKSKRKQLTIYSKPYFKDVNGMVSTL